MIDIAVHDIDGQQVGTLQLDEQALGGEVRPILLKQAFVRQHSNHRQGSAATRNRARVEGSTRKLGKQKGSGNARHGPDRANLMRGGGMAHAKEPKSWRLGMPRKMRRLANRNAVLAKAVDGQIKLIDGFNFDQPSTKRFSSLMASLGIDRTCLVALANTTGHEALSARNVDYVEVTRMDQLNVYALLNHRYLLADKPSFEAWIQGAIEEGR